MGWDDSLFIDAEEFYPLDDENLLIVTSARTHSAFLYLCDLRTHEVKDSMLLKGNGPSEVLSCMVTSSNPFVFDDYVKGNLYSIEVENILRRNKAFHSMDYNGLQPITSMFPLDDDTIIYENPYADASFSQNCSDHYPRLVKDAPSAMLSRTKRMIGIYNVSQGAIAANLEKNRLVYAGLDASIIELYDMELNPLLRVCGPKSLVIKYRDSGERISFDKSIPYSYLDINTTPEYIYVNYYGRLIDDGGHDIYLDKGYIMKFTWDGELVGCYSIDRLPYSIYVRDDKTLYVTMKDDREARALYSCQLP